MLFTGDCPPTFVRWCHRTTCISLCTVTIGLLSGCGNVLYTYRANSASSKLEEAKAAGAELTATYEYTLAQEHLRKSMSEASEADYGDAYELAGLADDYAQKALDRAQHRAAMPPDKAPPSSSATPQASASLSFGAGERQ